MSSAPQSPFPPDIADARARLGASYRRLGHAIAGHLVEVDVLDRLTTALDAATAELDALPARDRVSERPTGDWGPPPASGEAMFSFDERPVSGRAAPLGFDVSVTRDGDEAVGRLTLGKAHEGAPSRSHGGIISALFDDLFGFVLTIAEQAGFTGELTIRYEAGTPIGVPLVCRVRMVERVGRKLLMTGELTPESDETQVFARATATFIAIDPERFRQLTTD
ncbi:MAG: PaaI family thioesterase [Ilumatobacter sp.]|jgi:acyl-coenzyme A thioesterase PaaI-like protein|uniref:PaaI family thioesterase n=1 Tax=Ilumatobacter sp. TaxID=1967498 RepID=UPI00391D6D99